MVGESRTNPMEIPTAPDGWRVMQFAESVKLEKASKASLRGLGYDLWFGQKRNPVPWHRRGGREKEARGSREEGCATRPTCKRRR
jgi:hypothetical protein